MIIYSYIYNIISFHFNKKTYTTITYKLTSKTFIKSFITGLIICLLIKSLLVYDIYSLFTGIILSVLHIIDNRQVLGEFPDNNYIKSKLMNFTNGKSEVSGTKQPSNDTKGKHTDRSSESNVGSNKGKGKVISGAVDNSKGESTSSSISFKKPVNFSNIDQKDLKYCTEYFKHMEKANAKYDQLQTENTKHTGDFFEKYSSHLSILAWIEIEKNKSDITNISKKAEIAQRVYFDYDFYDKTKFGKYQRDAVSGLAITDLLSKQVDIAYKDLHEHLNELDISKSLLETSYKNTRKNLDINISIGEIYQKTDYQIRLEMFDKLIKRINKEK